MGRYYTEYGEVKSKVMKIGRKEARETFKFGKKTLMNTHKYKYIGQIMNERNNAEDHIKEIKGKSEAAFQITQIIAGNDNFSRIKVEAYWELLSSCVSYGKKAGVPPGSVLYMFLSVSYHICPSIKYIMIEFNYTETQMLQDL